MPIEVARNDCDEKSGPAVTERELGILHLEDNDEDAELVGLLLSKLSRRTRITRVETRADFIGALDRAFDVILSDFSLPDFDGLSALSAARQRDTEVPFIFVSGTIGEDRAVLALRSGATDYVLKDRLSRLPSAIQRALEERQERVTRHAAEARIREQAALLENAREAIVIQDLERRVTYWNRGAEQMYGWSSDEAVAREADVRFAPEVLAEREAAWQTVLRAGKWDGTFRQRTRDGREIVVEEHWTRAHHAENAPPTVITIGSDVTEARSLEARLLRAQRLETVGMVASGVAHDLNNVMAPILIGIASLKRRISDEGGQRLLSTMELSVERGSDIVRQVVTFARGGPEPSSRVDVREAVRGIERLVAASLSKKVRFELDLPDDLWPVAADPTQLQQVLLNLCVNARDAMPQGGRLAVGAENVTLPGETPGRYVRIRVSDNGVGMSEEIKNRIFEPFFTTKTQGNGIGLSTVASIVKRHGGRIEVDSELSRGTEFRVLLPVVAKAAVAEKAAAAVRAHGQMLLVLDEGSVREILRGVLEAYGYRVLGAENAIQAVELHAQHVGEISAVLANISIQQMDGVALIRALSRQDPHVKVINTSGVTDILQAPGVESLVRATLPKPYTADKLLDVVGHVLEMA